MAVPVNTGELNRSAPVPGGQRVDDLGQRDLAVPVCRVGLDDSQLDGEIGGQTPIDQRSRPGSPDASRGVKV